MALHKKAFTNNEALKYPEQKCQQFELGSAVVVRSRPGWGSGEETSPSSAWLREGASKAMGSKPASTDCRWESQTLAGILNPAADQGLVTLVVFRAQVDTQKSMLAATELGFLRLL